jgi:hypothetical protein
MQEAHFGDQVIRFDRDKTKDAYTAISVGGAERCGCAYCTNFAAQRLSAFPASFRSILETMGIDVTKEGEVYEAGPDDDLRIYGGWFYFSGEIVKPGERTTSEASGFTYWFTDPKRFPKPSADFGASIAAVEFLTRIRWVLANDST